MTDVLIRDVSADDLEVIRAAAAERGVSLQSYLWETVRARAAYLRRQGALTNIERQLQDRPAVSESERAAVLDEIAGEEARRAKDLGGRPHL